MKDILFISQSPLQLVNNIEAQHYFNYNHCKHLIFVRDQSSENAINEILKEFEVNDFSIIKINFCIKFFFLLNFLKYRNRFNTIFFGNTNSFTSYIVNLNKNARTVHVDDGTRTLQLLKLNLKSSFFRRRFSFLSKKYLLKSEFFTYYYDEAISEKKIAYKNNLFYFKTRELNLSNSEIIPGEKSHKIFIGTNILSTHMDIESEFKKLNDIIGLKHTIYIMHRYDNAILVNRFAMMYEFTALKIDLPLELFFSILWKRNKPLVFSFGSSAIDTLQLIFPDLEVTVFKFNYNLLRNKETAKAFENLFEKYSKNERIKIIESSYQ